MKQLHTKAFKYAYDFTAADGKPTRIIKVIALMPGCNPIENLIRHWNHIGKGSNQVYTLLEEIPVKEAIYIKGLKGTMIATDWQLLSHMPYHSLEISIDKA